MEVRRRLQVNAGNFQISGNKTCRIKQKYQLVKKVDEKRLRVFSLESQWDRRASNERFTGFQVQKDRHDRAGCIAEELLGIS